MSVNLLSTNIVNAVRERLLNKINRLIARRNVLLSNMNLYSLDHLTKLIGEINEQLVSTVSEAAINQVPEIVSIPTDNLMAMCDSKSLLEPTHVEDAQSVTSSKVADSYRKRRLSLISRAERSESIDPTKPFSFHQYNGSFVPLREGEGEAESREIEAYREMKRKELEQQAKKLAHEIHNKERVPINLNVEDVMFDFEGELTKLEKSKEKKLKGVPQVLTALRPHQYDQKKKRRRVIELTNRHIATSILDKTNVTTRELEAEKEKKNRQRSYTKSSAHPEEEILVGLVKVNLESHKQHEQAIAVKQPGVKITIKEREFSAEKETAKALTKITRRLSKSEYIQFKADEEKRKIIKNATIRFIEKTKSKPEEAIKTEPVKEEPKPAPEEKTNHRLSLTLDNAKTTRDQSRIFIHSVLGKAELIKEVKHKPYLTEPSEELKNKRDALSTVDKYNLLYVKYNGFPPQSTYESLAKELQTQRKEAEKIKENTLLLTSGKKQTYRRENRLVNSRNS